MKNATERILHRITCKSSKGEESLTLVLMADDDQFTIYEETLVKEGKNAGKMTYLYGRHFPRLEFALKYMATRASKHDAATLAEYIALYVSHLSRFTAMLEKAGIE